MAKQKQSTEITSWDKELAEQAQAAAKVVEGVGVGQFFGTRAGVLTWAGSPIPGSQMGCIIAAGVLEHAFYEGDFDSENPASPVCFAFGTSEDAMAPHEKSSKPQAASCNVCPNNVFGSADRGKGKACKNQMRLAMLPAGMFNAAGVFELDDDPSHYKTAAPGYFRVSVTSVKGYAAYVNQLKDALRRPPHGVITKVKVSPDPKTQLRTTFELLGPVPNELMPAVMARHKELAASIDFPYMASAEAEAKPAGKVVKKKKY